jgi:hypothetical protein
MLVPEEDETLLAFVRPACHVEIPQPSAVIVSRQPSANS